MAISIKIPDTPHALWPRISKSRMTGADQFVNHSQSSGKLAKSFGYHFKINVSKCLFVFEEIINASIIKIFKINSLYVGFVCFCSFFNFRIKKIY